MTLTDRDRHDPLSVPEMLRIMDAATALRQGRELVDEQLNFDQFRERLKERMLAASKVTGESVTPEEVDLAIGQFYADLHTFREPKLTIPVALAHLWVRRGTILGVGGVLLALAALVWAIFFTPSGVGGGNAHIVNSLVKEIRAQEGKVKTLSTDPAAPPRIARFHEESEVYRANKDAEGLRKVHAALEDLESKLLEEYTVIAVPQDTVSGKNKNTIVRYPPGGKGGKIKAYYLFVQARKLDGSTLPRRIRSAEDASEKVVTTWAEQIPEAVYDRLGKDKLEDGVLNETAFAVKRRGRLDEEVTMPGPDGKPLARMGRITGW